MCSIDGSPGLSTCHGPAAFAPHSLTPASAQSPKGRRAKTSLSLLYFTSLVNSIFFYFWHIFTLASELVSYKRKLLFLFVVVVRLKVSRWFSCTFTWNTSCSMLSSMGAFIGKSVPQHLGSKKYYTVLS